MNAHDDSAPWSVVVVNYEAGPALVDCVRSLVADTSAGGPPEVVVVDNGSSDGSVAALASAVPGVEVLRSATNVGYGTAANRGIAATRAPVVLVCNPDARTEPGTAAAMLRRFETESDLGAAGPRISDTDGIWYPSARMVPGVPDAVGHAVFGFVWRRNPWTRRYRQLHTDPALPRDVDWVSGAAIWLRRSAAASVGGFDERYFMYVEDVDLCWALRRAGWRVAYEPGGSVVHVQGVSTARHPYRMILEHHRSLARFAAKRWRGVRRLLVVPAVAFLTCRAVVVMAARAIRERYRRAARGTARTLG